MSKTSPGADKTWAAPQPPVTLSESLGVPEAQSPPRQNGDRNYPSGSGVVSCRNPCKVPTESTRHLFETVGPAFPADKVPLLQEALTAYCVLRGRRGCKATARNCVELLLNPSTSLNTMPLFIPPNNPVSKGLLLSHYPEGKTEAQRI